jgi:hypothetical protein
MTGRDKTTLMASVQDSVLFLSTSAAVIESLQKGVAEHQIKLLPRVRVRALYLGTALFSRVAV